MTNAKEFTAYKKTIDRDLITISGTKEELLGGALAPMFPISPTDTFQLNIVSSIEPVLIHNLIIFSIDEFFWDDGDPYWVPNLTSNEIGVK